MHRVELKCESGFVGFNSPLASSLEALVRSKSIVRSGAKLGFLTRRVPFRHRMQSPTNKTIGKRSVQRARIFMLEATVSLQAVRTDAHRPLKASHLEQLAAVRVVVEKRDSTWHTKASGMLRCNVRSKSR